MDPIQKSNLIVFLQEMLRERDSHINLLTGKLDDIQQSLNEALKLLKSRDTELERLKKDKADLEEKFKALESRHGVLTMIPPRVVRGMAESPSKARMMGATTLTEPQTL